mgnify:CR=1 FL=1
MVTQVRIELACFQELIYYWTSLRFSTTLLAFTLLALPVFQVPDSGVVRGRGSGLCRAVRSNPGTVLICGKAPSSHVWSWREWCR